MANKPSGTVSSILAKRLEKASRAVAAREKERERRRYESVIILIGTHMDCGGTVVYSSLFVPEGKDSMREEAECCCKKCGQPFPPDFPPIQRLIEEYRAGD